MFNFFTQKYYDMYNIYVSYFKLSHIQKFICLFSSRCNVKGFNSPILRLNLKWFISNINIDSDMEMVSTNKHEFGIFWFVLFKCFTLFLYSTGYVNMSANILMRFKQFLKIHQQTFVINIHFCLYFNFKS